MPDSIPDFSMPSRSSVVSKGLTAVAGVDEVGVGALARPIVAAAVILAPDVTVDGLGY
jgi:ribonuclease HIII